jgi:hypothetical protein
LHFASNVVVTICLNEEMQQAGHLQQSRYNRFLPLDHPHNALSVQLLRDWIKALGHGSLWVWDHAENGGDRMEPMPNYYLLAERIKTLATMGVTGYFADGSMDLHTDMNGLKVRKTPSWPRSWANFSIFIAVLPQEYRDQLAYFGRT